MGKNYRGPGTEQNRPNPNHNPNTPNVTPRSWPYRPSCPKKLATHQKAGRNRGKFASKTPSWPYRHVDRKAQSWPSTSWPSGFKPNELLNIWVYYSSWPYRTKPGNTQAGHMNRSWAACLNLWKLAKRCQVGQSWSRPAEPKLCNMLIWHHMTSYGITWHHMTSYGIIWHHMALYDILWHHMASYDIIWHRMASYGIVCHHMASYDFIFHHMASYGIVWHHMT